MRSYGWYRKSELVVNVILVFLFLTLDRFDWIMLVFQTFRIIELFSKKKCLFEFCIYAI